MNDIVHVLEPYDGPGSLTEGLDWEAEQGKKGWESVMGRSVEGGGENEKEGEEEGKDRGWWEGMGADEDEEVGMI